jgi:hypothetical protein
MRVRDEIRFYERGGEARLTEWDDQSVRVVWWALGAERLTAYRVSGEAPWEDFERRLDLVGRRWLEGGRVDRPQGSWPIDVVD